jgi:hypothetical protein
MEGRKRLTLIIDEELHRRLAAWAKRERRSLHGQLLVILQDAVEAEEHEVTPVGL